MLGKTVFFKTCFINKLYKYKWHVTFLLPTYILYKTTKIPDARTYFTPLSCNEDNTLSFNIHHPLLGTWHYLNKIANYTSGCIYHLDPVLFCIQIWVGQHAQTIGLSSLLAHFYQTLCQKTFHSPHEDKLKIDMESPLHTFYVTCKQTYPYNA